MVSCVFAVWFWWQLVLKSWTWILVVTSTWSDRPCNVVGSHSTRCVGSEASMRSMQDFFNPFSYVHLAGGPGYIPFSIYQLLDSHNPITHCALAFMFVSSLCLKITFSPIFGCKFPTLVFQSPHTTDLEFRGIFPKMSSMLVFAFSSS